MTITSTSSLDEIEAEMFDNDGFEAAGSAAMAAAYARAARLWLMRVPSSTGTNGHNTTMNVAAVQKMLDRANAFASLAGQNGSGVKILGPDTLFR
jgi:hypothetical protein